MNTTFQPKEGWNKAIHGEPGKGMSYISNVLLKDIKTHVYVVDRGNSFKPIAELLGGRRIAFGSRTKGSQRPTMFHGVMNRRGRKNAKMSVKRVENLIQRLALNE